jgi:hypothetical protein
VTPPKKIVKKEIKILETNKKFSLPLNWKKAVHGMRNDGWYMKGIYKTLTDSDGSHRLHIDASLVSP